ncbi:uncharacterized protein PITG_05309 [Phytophthora infestans T30-4]|uniref:DDE Tnp4 domain-containing protein n=1 Tax=Phytophthora infestans (strain T30-4) TaxID=403677 RepID=D0N419_PHYIT|nr:uncharacterized protein PITG_05309 [Phytophthora infestans T30-4]EEY69123.1 conserved hypothetical protein [Phytophthora infestans T30-4]|eukprot:XP_002998977.1 conserved hypothetical protein [Phytophthora infestans T30-4]
MFHRDAPVNVFTFQCAIAFETMLDEHFERVVACTLFHLGSSGGFRETAQAFGESKAWCIGFPLCCGAIDGTLIAINRPQEFEGWYNRKGFPSLNVQAVCDHRKRFTSLDVRPGSWSDAKIFEFSVFGRNIERILPRGHHILADAGYDEVQLQVIFDPHGD